MEGDENPAGGADDKPAERPGPGDEQGRVGLSRESILEVAIDLIDREGLKRLTMRRLGAVCGVEAMALYRYVHSREGLLGGIVDHLVDRLHREQLAARRAEDGWQDFLVRLAHGVRAIAVEHPELFPLLASRAPEAPWVRPPLRSLRWMETFLETLLGYGFDDRTAVAAYRAYTTFLLGQLLLEVSARGPGAAPIEPTPLHTEPVDLADYPNLGRLRPMLSQDHTRAEFDDALEAVLERLDVQLRGS